MGKCSRPCFGCSSDFHSQKSQNCRPTKYPLWGKQFQKSKIINHLAQLCHQKTSSNQENALILGSMPILHHTNIYFLVTIMQESSMREIPPILSSRLLKHKNIQSVETNILPYSGANTCLTGQYIAQLNLDVFNLITCNKQVSTVGGSKISCIRCLPSTFQIGNKKKTTWQPLFINKLDKIYSLKQGCIDLSMLHSNVSTPVSSSMSSRDTGSATAQLPPAPVANSVNVTK